MNNLTSMINRTSTLPSGLREVATGLEVGCRMWAISRPSCDTTLRAATALTASSAGLGLGLGMFSSSSVCSSTGRENRLRITSRIVLTVKFPSTFCAKEMTQKIKELGFTQYGDSFCEKDHTSPLPAIGRQLAHSRSRPDRLTEGWKEITIRSLLTSTVVHSGARRPHSIGNVNHCATIDELVCKDRRTERRRLF